MTYDAREISADLGAPVEIYEFTRGAYRLRFTSADAPVVYVGQTFAPMPITRTSIEAGLEAVRATLTVTVPRTMEVADWHRVAPPADVVTLTIWQRHLGDPNNEFAVIWRGRVVSVDFQGAAAEIACESVYTSIRRAGLRRAYQRTCPHVLYSGECRASSTAFETVGTIGSVAGLVVTSAVFGALASGYLVGGFIQLPRISGQFERRGIVAHTGSNITLSQATEGLIVGAVFSVFPGCDHTMPTCSSKFSNLPNYGGMPYLPTKNPFDGSPVY